MFFEEFLYQGVHSAIKLLVGFDLLHVLVEDGLEDHLAHLGKSVIMIILANGEIDIISLYTLF